MLTPMRSMGAYRLQLGILTVCLLTCISSGAQSPAASTDLARQVDGVAQQVLATTGVPSASVAVVRDGQLAYAQAYGAAELEPRINAQPQMRYSIGSISKQFTAAAVMLLAEEGKLSLDDKVSRFLPNLNLTRANEVTIRQLLSHTSGYQDYWPQDYVPPLMTRPTTAEAILDRWARKPLDFEPGSRWEYSNTNYVIAGLIVEKASATPLFEFLRTRVFSALHMDSVFDVDQSRLTESDPTGYMRYALGPLHPAPKEGRGWIYAAGELAMRADDLAKWDISVINQALLKPSSYKAMETEVQLNNGVGTSYGLGLFVANQSGRRSLYHGGEVSGFTAENIIYPDDKVAIAVLTNQDAVGAASDIAHRIARAMFTVEDANTRQKEQEARRILEGLQHGTIDRSLFTANANAYFSDVAVRDFAGSLGPLGAIQSFTYTRQQARGGMLERIYHVQFPQKALRVWTYEIPDGKLEQYQVAPAD